MLQQLGTSSANTTYRQLVNKFVTTCLQTCNNDLCGFTLVWQVVFAMLAPSCCNKFETTSLIDGIYNQTCYVVVPTGLIQPWYNKNVTRLTTQSCNNIVISWLYRTCWNSLATSLILSQGCYKLLTACSKHVDNLGQAARTQLDDGLLADLLHT
jgi:hypothetical protein